MLSAGSRKKPTASSSTRLSTLGWATQYSQDGVRFEYQRRGKNESDLVSSLFRLVMSLHRLVSPLVMEAEYL